MGIIGAIYLSGLGLNTLASVSVGPVADKLVRAYNNVPSQHSPHYVETEINTPSESTLLITEVLHFFQLNLPVQSYGLLNMINARVYFDRTCYL